jgi:uncharacterized membrane protein YfcA
LDVKTLENRGWNPYLAGALSGLVSVFSVAIAGKFLGASTTFVRSAGMIEKLFSPDRVARMAYFMKEAPKVDWQWMFVVGIFIGAFIAAKTGRTFRWQALPPRRIQENSGDSILNPILYSGHCRSSSDRLLWQPCLLQ